MVRERSKCCSFIFVEYSIVQEREVVSIHLEAYSIGNMYTLVCRLP